MSEKQQTDKCKHMSRRSFVATTAATATSVAVASVVLSNLSGCKKSGSDASSPTVVSEGAIKNILDSYKQVDFSYKEAGSWNLPLGCIVRPAQGEYCAVLAPGATAAQPIKGAIFSTKTGALHDVVPKCATQMDTSWVIYDARCSDSVYAWVELNFVSRAWVVYAQALSAGGTSAASGSGAAKGEKAMLSKDALSKGAAVASAAATPTPAAAPTKLWEANADYDPPQLACWQDYVFWQVSPSASGKKRRENSKAYLWKLQSDQAKVVIESPGRFGIEPAVSGSLLTVAPRVPAKSGVLYSIASYDFQNKLASAVDQLTLPTSVKPFYATRIGDKFVFSIEASYASGGQLGKMGTYIGGKSQGFIGLLREPAAAACGAEAGIYIIKSKASYFVVDTKQKTYAVLTANDRSLDYGEYPAREGTTDNFVTFSTIKDKGTGYPSAVVVRSFTL